MKLPNSNFGKFSLFFGTQFAIYALIVANVRAYTQVRYAWTAGTDVVFASLNFVVTQAVAKQETGDRVAWIGYVLGGTMGSLAAIWITVRLYGA